MSLPENHSSFLTPPSHLAMHLRIVQRLTALQSAGMVLTHSISLTLVLRTTNAKQCWINDSHLVFLLKLQDYVSLCPKHRLQELPLFVLGRDNPSATLCHWPRVSEEGQQKAAFFFNKKKVLVQGLHLMIILPVTHFLTSQMNNKPIKLTKKDVLSSCVYLQSSPGCLLK